VLLTPALSQAGTPIIVSIPGSIRTDITAINASGTMAGICLMEPGGAIYAFLATKPDLSDYVTIDIGAPGGQTLASGIGPDGTLVGSFCDGEDCSPPMKLHGYLRDKSGAVTVWDHPAAGGHFTQFLDINARGQIIGYYMNRDTVPITQSGFLLDRIGAEPVPIQHPDPNYLTFPYGINLQGTVVGEVRLLSAPVNESLAFVWRGGALTLFAVPDGSGGTYGTLATSINDRGEIVGAYWLPSPWRTVGYRLRAGVVTSVTVEGKGVRVNAINNAGTMVGICDEYLGPAKIEGLIVPK
jgi:uncharacterized membrane protein